MKLQFPPAHPHHDREEIKLAVSVISNRTAQLPPDPLADVRAALRTIQLHTDTLYNKAIRARNASRPYNKRP